MGKLAYIRTCEPPSMSRPEEGVRGWNGRGRYGSAFTAVPAGHQGAPAAVPHGPLRGVTRRSEAMAHERHPAFAPDRGGCARGLPLGHEPEKRVRESGYRP